jgi:hypothetical protein
VTASGNASGSVKAGPKTGDFVAGAGGGGILVYCAQHFIPEPSISQVAVYACPALSMFFVGLYQKLSKFALGQFEYFISDLERKRLLKKSNEDIEDCRKQLAAIEANPGSSEQHKIDARKDLEALEKIHFKLRLKGSVQMTSA